MADNDEKHYSEVITMELLAKHGWSKSNGFNSIKKKFENLNRTFYGQFDERGRYLLLKNGFEHLTDHPDDSPEIVDIDCRGRKPEEVATEFDLKAQAVGLQFALANRIRIDATKQSSEKSASLNIEERSIAFANAEIITKASMITSASGVSNRLFALRGLNVEVLTQEKAELWAEIDATDFHCLEAESDKGIDALLVIAGNLNSNAYYKAGLISFAPEIAEKAIAQLRKEEKKIEAKETRKSAEMADMNSLCEAGIIAGVKESFVIVDSQSEFKCSSAKVLGLTSKHVVLGLGRSAAILNQGDLDRPLVANEVVSITLKNGNGRVSPPALATEMER